MEQRRAVSKDDQVLFNWLFKRGYIDENGDITEGIPAIQFAKATAVIAFYYEIQIPALNRKSRERYEEHVARRLLSQTDDDHIF